jgi:hypothetical protein
MRLGSVELLMDFESYFKMQIENAEQKTYLLFNKWQIASANIATISQNDERLKEQL